METTEFGKRYLESEGSITKVLRGLRIYDEDLLHDTYIALYEHSQQAEIGDFVNTFVAFYRARYKRRGQHESHYITCDYTTMVEQFDREDESDLDYRERVAQRVDDILAKYAENPLPGERNHERSVKVLQLYRDGLTFREIAAELGIDVAAVHRHFDRAIKRIKSQQEMATI